MATYSGISKFSAFDPVTGDFIQLNMLSNQSNFEHTLIEDEETTGGGYGGANYRLEIIAGDLTPQMYELFQEWQELKTPLEFYGYGPDFFLQWLQKRTVSIAPVDASNATSGRRKYRILVTFSGITSQIRWGANLLHLVQPWRESALAPGQPEGYTFEGSVTNRNWDKGIFTFNISGSTASRINSPVIGSKFVLIAEYTLSFDFISIDSGQFTFGLAISSLSTTSLIYHALNSQGLEGQRAFRNVLISELSGDRHSPVFSIRGVLSNAATDVQISNPAIRAGKNHRYIEE